MGTLWLKIRVWVKVIAFVILFVYTVTFIAKNSSKPVQPWLWYNTEPETTALLLALYAFLAGVVLTLLLRTILKTINQMRDVKKRNQDARTDAAVRKMEAGGPPPGGRHGAGGARAPA